MPGKTSSLCSDHFAVDDFERLLSMEFNLKRDLKKDVIGVCVYPTKHAKQKEMMTSCYLKRVRISKQ